MYAPKRRHNKSNIDSGFGLAFLDVLCCGLGAAVLLFLIVKHEPPALVFDLVSKMLSSQSQIYQEESVALQKSIQAEQSEIEFLESEIKEISAEWKGFAKESSRFVNNYLSLKREIEKYKSQSETFKLALELSAEESRVKDGPKVDSSYSPQGAIEGIQLNGIDRVVILFDTSASMLHQSLVEIIRLRISNDKIKKQAKKWKQGIASLNWGIEAISENMRYKVLTYSDKTFELNGKLAQTTNIKWDLKTKEIPDFVAIQNQVNQLVPGRGTNLASALDAVTGLIPRPKKILIITDGLPSLMPGEERERLRGCPKRAKRRSNLIDGSCRLSVAIASVEPLSRTLARVPVDVILFPLDGDRDAVRFYSLVSSISSGRLLTPSKDWLL